MVPLCGPRVAAACALGAALALLPVHAFPFAVRTEARLWLGHDSNLLDISDLERRSFETGYPRTFFAVDRLSDQFLHGSLDAEWEAPRAVAGRPGLRLGWERRQYLHEPIRSENRLTAGLRARPREGTRVDLQADYRPQLYNRHRSDLDALPGEPQFRPEVYRRWDLELDVRQSLERRMSVHGSLEATTRRYRAPFEERDRRAFGGGVGLTRSFERRIMVHGRVHHRGTWTQNDPSDPDDRSHRAWRASSGVTLGDLPCVKSARLDVEFEWRRFTSRNPDDDDHFGRRDRGGEAQVEIVRALVGSLDWASRVTWRWRSSDFPVAVVDEEGVFEEAVFRTGVVWEGTWP